MPTPLPEIDHLLARLLASVSAALGDQLVGLYLGGSLATGTFNPDTSDVDFVAITEGDITGNVENRLRAAHDAITALPSPWARKLECAAARGT